MIELESEAASEELDLSQYVEILSRRRWIVVSVTAFFVLGTFLHTFTTRPVFQASALLLIERSRGDRIIYSNASGMMWEEAEDFYPTQYKLLKSDSLMRQVYEDLRLDNTQDFKQPGGFKKLAGAVTVSPVPRSRLVYIKADSHDPQLAARIANALSRTFVEQNLNNLLYMSKGVLQALQAGNDRPDHRRVYEGLPAVVNNQLLQALKAEYAKLQSQAADMSARYTSKHPSVLAVKSNMASVQAQIQAETEKIVQSLKTELSGQLAANNVRVIDAALVPSAPIWPQKSQALLIGSLGGLMLGFLAAYIVELLDQSVRTQQDVERKLRLPFLASVPFHAHESQEGVYSHLLAKHSSLTSEAFRNLRTMVDFAGIEGRAKAMLVTSTVQMEGKSYVASNLAVAFAQLGEKVLLLEGDFRRPRLHKNFWLSAERGICDFLAAGTAVQELPGLIQSTAVPGLSVLVCGPRPPNPAELLNTPRLEALVGWARASFDRVIVDCAPLFPISDTLLWGRHVRSAVFAVRYGGTRASLVRNAARRLETHGVKVLGAVVNATQRIGIAYYAYGYYYQPYYRQYHDKPSVSKT